MYQTRNFNHRVPRSLGGFIEDLFQNGKVFTDDLWNENKMHVPVNIYETDNAYLVDVVAPGLKKEDIKLNLEKNNLTIDNYSDVPPSVQEPVPRSGFHLDFRHYQKLLSC